MLVKIKIPCLKTCVNTLLLTLSLSPPLTLSLSKGMSGPRPTGREPA